VSHENGILQELSPEELCELRGDSWDVDLVAGQVLHEPSETIDAVYLPYDGLVSLLIATPSGAIAEVGFVGSEGIVGTLNSSLAPSSFTRSQIVASGKALPVPFDQYKLAMHRSEHFRGLVAQNNNRVAGRAQQIAACNLLHRLEPRLCRWLLQIFDNVVSADVVITQETLAQMLGVSRARLNETLKSLQAAKAVSLTQRGQLTILDANLVAERVCDCYRTMRLLKAS